MKDENIIYIPMITIGNTQYISTEFPATTSIELAEQNQKEFLNKLIQHLNK